MTFLWPVIALCRRCGGKHNEALCTKRADDQRRLERMEMANAGLMERQGMSDRRTSR